MPTYDGDDRPVWFDRDPANSAKQEYFICMNNCLMCFEQQTIPSRVKLGSILKQTIELKKSRDS